MINFFFPVPKKGKTIQNNVVFLTMDYWDTSAHSTDTSYHYTTQERGETATFTFY